MNKILRDGVDVAAAWDVQSKKLVIQNEPTMEVAMSEENPTPIVNPAVSTPVSSWKAIARKGVRMLFRLLKPALRPVAFRARHFLIAGLRTELLQEIQKASHQTVQEAQRASAITGQHIQEMQKANFSAMREAHEASSSLQDQIKTLNLYQSVISKHLDRIELYSAAAARRVAIHCEADEMLIRTEVGFVLCAASDHAVIAALVENGELEPGTRRLIQRFLKPGDTFVDIGANIGMLTLAAARAMEGKGRIFAFEPFEKTARMLERSVWMNGFSPVVNVYHAAVSNRTGQQHLHLGSTSGHHSLYDLSSFPEQSQKTVEVSLVTVDSIKIAGPGIDLMKIDAEGAELDIIEGSLATIAANPHMALIVEFGPSHLKRTGRTTAEWFGILSGLGFEYRVINESTGALEEWTIEALHDIYSANIFLARPDSQAWSRVA
jgi:FkbM family methyltransferase